MTRSDRSTGTDRRRVLRSAAALIAVVLVAVVSGLLTGYRVTLSPFAVHARGLEFSSAQTSVLIDRRDSVLGSGAQPRGAAPLNTLQTLTSRAQVFAGIASAPSGRASIGRRIGLDGSQVSVTEQFVANIPRIATDSRDQERAAQLLDDRTRVSLLMRVDDGSPLIQIYARAPDTAQARAAADAAADLVVGTAARAGDDQRSSSAQAFSASIVARRLGAASGSVVSPHAPIQAALLVGLAVLGIGSALVLRLRRRPWTHDDGTTSRTGVSSTGRTPGAIADRGPGQVQDYPRADDRPAVSRSTS